MSLRLSEKHGVNPTIPVCWWCNKPRNELVLTGAAGEAMARSMGCNNGEMPRECILDMNPCDECLGLMDLGIIFVSVKKHCLVKYQEVMQHNRGCRSDRQRKTYIPERAGPMAVLREEAVRRMLGHNQDLLQHILDKRSVFIQDDEWEQMGLPVGNFDNRDKEGT